VADNPDFLACVDEWICSKGIDVLNVKRVVPFGTDWGGDSENGFYSTFSVTVEYVTRDGSEGSWQAVGEDMESLWLFVVKGWPELNT